MKYLGAPIYLLLYAICISIIWIMIFPIVVLAALYYVWVERRYHKYRIIELNKLFRFNSMINKWVLIVYTAIVSLLGIIYYLNHDNFGTISYTAYPEIIQRILGVNSVLVGVIISLLILTFRVLNENYGNFAFRAIFKSKFNRILISVFLFNFFLSMYSLMYWHQNEYNSYYAILFWITLSSNIFLLCTAFPFAFLSLRSASQESNFDTILESLDEEWAGMYITNRVNHNRQIFNLQINPIKEVTGIGRKLIEAEEYDSFRLLDKKYYNQLKSLSEIDYELRCFFYHEYKEFINVLFTPSLKSEAHFFTSYLVYRRIDLEKEMLLLKINKKQNPVWVHNHHYIQIDFSPFFYKTTVIKDETYFDAVITAYLSLGEFYIQK